jgi:glycosyltransferase involved in cell wall biosynthesis
LATRVGHFPETIDDGFNGYLANAADIQDMAKQMNRFLDHPLDPNNVAEKTKAMSWANYAQAILAG